MGFVFMGSFAGVFDDLVAVMSLFNSVLHCGC